MFNIIGNLASSVISTRIGYRNTILWLAPALAPQNKAAALSVLSLGAGASTWVGPAIVAIFQDSFGLEGVVWAFTGLCALSAVMTAFLQDPEPVWEPNLTKIKRKIRIHIPRLDKRWAHASDSK
ncbi:hypothetical protein AABC73_01280 [Pseudomonas sp. G.S.17]|uniref:hypothetical protein n=1 Tax=Pseudomonas sp. G.S.17 TaxID=3137451 RepID=UPI00311CC6FE